jgi:hypothetical protein
MILYVIQGALGACLYGLGWITLLAVNDVQGFYPWVLSWHLPEPFYVSALVIIGFPLLLTCGLVEVLKKKDA